MSFFDTPDYLELPESLIIACNEDDKDNVSSESGGGASSGGSLGSIPNTCGGITSTSATSLETSNDSISSEHGSDKTVLNKPKEGNKIKIKTKSKRLKRRKRPKRTKRTKRKKR